MASICVRYLSFSTFDAVGSTFCGFPLTSVVCLLLFVTACTDLCIDVYRDTDIISFPRNRIDYYASEMNISAQLSSSCGLVFWRSFQCNVWKAIFESNAACLSILMPNSDGGLQLNRTRAQKLCRVQQSLKFDWIICEVVGDSPAVRFVPVKLCHLCNSWWCALFQIQHQSENTIIAKHFC